MKIPSESKLLHHGGQVLGRERLLLELVIGRAVPDLGVAALTDEGHILRDARVLPYRPKGSGRGPA